MRATSELTSAFGLVDHRRAWSGPPCISRCCRCRLQAGFVRGGLRFRGWPAGAPLRVAPDSQHASPRCSDESSSRASTWPSRTAMPSSTLTSDHLAGDLRRHGGPASSGDVARGIQDPTPDVPAAPLGHARRLRPPPAVRGSASTRRHHRHAPKNQQQEHHPLHPAAAAGVQGLALDAQGQTSR